jgi:hypothetical protein
MNEGVSGGRSVSLTAELFGLMSVALLNFKMMH